jgi:NCS2 family nucleobase:cation symporter-2
MTFTVGDFTFNGIVNGTVIAVVGYQIMRGISRARGTSQE